MVKRRRGGAKRAPKLEVTADTLPLFPEGSPGYRADGKYDKALKLTAKPQRALTASEIDRAQKRTSTKQLPCAPDCLCHHPQEYAASHRK